MFYHSVISDPSRWSIGAVKLFSIASRQPGRLEQVGAKISDSLVFCVGEASSVAWSESEICLTTRKNPIILVILSFTNPGAISSVIGNYCRTDV